MRWRALGILAAVAVVVAMAMAVGVGAPAAATKLHVRVITCCPITQGTWDPSHYKAYGTLAKKDGWDLQIAQTVPYGKADQVLDRWGAQHADIVFSTDNGFQGSMLRAAKKYPQTLWVTMSDMSTTDGLKNVGAYTVDWCQLGFVQGAAAAAISKTHHIGAVGAIPILPAKKTLAGMAVGANLIHKGTKIDVQYSGDFIDAQKAQQSAAALMGKGADVVIGVTQGSISPSIAASVQQAGKWYVGSFGDERRFAPKATVTSAVLNLNQGYAKVAQQRLDGDFTPGIHRGTIAEGFIKLTPFRLGQAGKQARVNALVKRAAAGKVNLSACEALK